MTERIYIVAAMEWGDEHTVRIVRAYRDRARAEKHVADAAKADIDGHGDEFWGGGPEPVNPHDAEAGKLGVLLRYVLFEADLE